MKKVSLIVAALALVSGLALAQNIKKGDEAKIPGHAWVTVLNPQPVASGNNNFAYGETCSINATGKVTVVGFVNEGGKERVLVRYSMPRQAFGAPCPSGVVFLLPKEHFSAMTAEHERIKTAEDQSRAQIAKILAGDQKK